MAIALRGLTWDHPRGYAPLVRGVPEYEHGHPGIKIHWDVRTLREFGEAPIEQYIDRYDLIVLDHPFVGFAAAHDVLVDLAPFLSEGEKADFALDSVGPSWHSYWYSGGLWAFPIDAATQVASYRPDALRELSVAPPKTFEDTLLLGQKARARGKCIIVAACPIDAISLFFTLTANTGHPIHGAADPFVTEVIARDVLDRMHAVLAVAHPRSIEWNPIQIYEYMIRNADAVYCPWAYGYSNYSRRDAPVPLRFVNPPAAGAIGCAGTQLGGTGIAVSRNSLYREEAVVYAKWLAGPEHQRGTYFRAGGQPSSLAAWTDPEIDAASGEFFSATLDSLRQAYVRPRFDGFVSFFERAGVEVNRCLNGDISNSLLIEWLNTRFAECLERAAERP